MDKRGQIVGGGLKNILIRERSGDKLEIGELLVANDNFNPEDLYKDRNYTILQIKDIEYKSQMSPAIHELLAGMELEGHNPDLGFVEPELANYSVAAAKPMLAVHQKKDKYETKSPKRLPNFFNPLFSIETEDLKFLKPKNTENSLYLGNVRSGSNVLEDLNVYINAKDALTHHILIPATTGRGKSNLVKVMLCSLLSSKDAGILVLDPHDEYYGRNDIGLKDHEDSEDFLEYYSTDPPVGQSKLIINIKSITPKQVKGLTYLTQAQSEAVYLLHNRFGENWIFETFNTHHIEGVHPKTLQVLKRKLENILGIYVKKDEDGEVKLGYRRSLFKGGVVGESTINNITESLEQGKIVIIDSSKLNDPEELLVGSMILEKLFYQYKEYNTDELRKKPVISVIIEEAPRVLGKEAMESPGGNNIYGTIAREGRKFQIGLIAITQLSSLIPKTILANMNTKIILGNEMSVERHAIIESAAQDLSEDNRIIASLDKGEAIVSSVFTKFAIPIKIPYFNDYIRKFQTGNDGKQEKVRTQISG